MTEAETKNGRTRRLAISRVGQITAAMDRLGRLGTDRKAYDLAPEDASKIIAEVERAFEMLKRDLKGGHRFTLDG